jgi:hypothetical protein
MPANYETMTNPWPGSDPCGGSVLVASAFRSKLAIGTDQAVRAGKAGGSCSGAVVADSAHDEEEEVGGALAWASEG